MYRYGPGETDDDDDDEGIWSPKLHLEDLQPYNAGFKAKGLGFEVWGLGFRVCGLGFRV